MGKGAWNWDAMWEWDLGMRGREKADIWACTSPCGFISVLLAAVAAVDLFKADVEALLCGAAVMTAFHSLQKL